LLVSRIADIDLPLFRTSNIKLFNVAKVRSINALLAQSDATAMDRVCHVLGGVFIHSPSFVQRRRPAPLRTAIAIARRWPTMTTRRLPRVTAV
jgi:hypothetical protein